MPERQIKAKRVFWKKSSTTASLMGNASTSELRFYFQGSEDTLVVMRALDDNCINSVLFFKTSLAVPFYLIFMLSMSG